MSLLGFVLNLRKTVLKLITVTTNVLYVRRAMTGTNLSQFRSVLWRWRWLLSPTMQTDDAVLVSPIYSLISIFVRFVSGFPLLWPPKTTKSATAADDRLLPPTDCCRRPTAAADRLLPPTDCCRRPTADRTAETTV